MTASRRARENTHYDELGLKPDATPAQIRDAFRLHVRLLHPDQHTDLQLKEIAESWMRKLNRIHSVLSDPEKRQQYDDFLEEDDSAPIVFDPQTFDRPQGNLKRWHAKLAWIGAIAVSALVLIWLASENQPGVQGHSIEVSTAPTANPSSSAPSFNATGSWLGGPVGNTNAQPGPASDVARLRTDLRAAIIERDAAVRELSRMRGLVQPGKAPGGLAAFDFPELKPPVTITELPSALRQPPIVSSPPARAERPANRQLTGFWFYAKPPLGQLNKNQSLYPPDYIEATILEDGAVIRGGLRSRFQIADRAISPDVNFTFIGNSNGTQASLPWNGSGGAKGEINLKLTGENSLHIDWTASELGTQQGLSSGTAVLTRRIE